MRSVDVLEALELLGSAQWGLVTTAQAQEAGVTRLQLSRLADRGTLQRVRHGVYALPSADSGPLQAVRAAWLATGGEPDVVVSGQSAAAVHGFGDLVPSKHEFTSPVRKRTRLSDLHHRKDDLSPDEVVTVDGLPVTSVPRTVNDLAGAGTDLDHLAAVVRDAFTTPGVTATDLASALDPHASTYGQNSGQALLASLLDSAGYAPDEGVLELYSERLQRAALQSFTPQFQQTLDSLLEARLQTVLKPAQDAVKALLERANVGSEQQTADLLLALRESLQPRLPSLDDTLSELRATMDVSSKPHRRGSGGPARSGTAPQVDQRQAGQRGST